MLWPYLVNFATSLLVIKTTRYLIEFWECSSRLNWNLHKVVNRDSKTFNPLPIYPCKKLWNYCKKIKCDDIINNWKMTFQASDGKGRQFLNLLDNNLNIIKSFYTKEDL